VCLIDFLVALWENYRANVVETIIMVRSLYLANHNYYSFNHVTPLIFLGAHVVCYNRLNTPVATWKNWIVTALQIITAYYWDQLIRSQAGSFRKVVTIQILHSGLVSFGHSLDLFVRFFSSSRKRRPNVGRGANVVEWITRSFRFHRFSSQRRPVRMRGRESPAAAARVPRQGGRDVRVSIYIVGDITRTAERSTGGHLPNGADIRSVGRRCGLSRCRAEVCRPYDRSAECKGGRECRNAC